jgi:hypothetical protein
MKAQLLDSWKGGFNLTHYGPGPVQVRIQIYTHPLMRFHP